MLPYVNGFIYEADSFIQQVLKEDVLLSPGLASFPELFSSGILPWTILTRRQFPNCSKFYCTSE